MKLCLFSCPTFCRWSPGPTTLRPMKTNWKTKRLWTRRVAPALSSKWRTRSVGEPILTIKETLTRNRMLEWSGGQTDPFLFILAPRSLTFTVSPFRFLRKIWMTEHVVNFSWIYSFQGDFNHLFIRQGTGLQGQAVFRTKLTFRPHSTDSFTHRKMTKSLAERSTKTSAIKILGSVGADPEAHRGEMIKVKSLSDDLPSRINESFFCF